VKAPDGNLLVRIQSIALFYIGDDYMDDFKKATCRDYTTWDLNCRSICPHDKYDNRFEKKIKRKARRKNKAEIKKLFIDK
jgi:hypothetical protein